MRNQLGDRLRHIRSLRLQPEMGAVMGVTGRAYANYERGERVPDATALAHLADEGWNINWLLTGQGNPRTDGTGQTAANPSFNQDVLQEAVETALEIIEKTGRYPDARGIARMVCLLYTEFLDTSTDPAPHLERILAKAREKAEQNT